jgi:hypothetical protein
MPPFGPPPRRDRNGIECGECQETGKEPADMRLPCNRLLDPSHAERAEPEQQVDAEQYQQEGEHARILQA